MKHLTAYKNKKVLVTGHTGFKGSWLCLWLQQIGAEVQGLSLSIPTKPAHFDLLKLDHPTDFVDVRDKENLIRSLRAFQPDIIFHMAAQSLVRESYKDPLTTIETNVMGTANLFEAAREIRNLKAIISITSDKCYENRESNHAYIESDALGGHDPYSASKACAEIITSSFAKSFFPFATYQDKHSCLVASVRAGNVIGGGDWAENRLLPDVFRDYFSGTTTIIKNPLAVRPWQHVLEPLNGYLMLGQKLLSEDKDFAGPWNFGPDANSNITVKEILKKIKELLPKLNYEVQGDQIHEAGLLCLNSTKANTKLAWKPLLSIDASLCYTAEWYQAFYERKHLLSLNQLNEYMAIEI